MPSSWASAKASAISCSWRRDSGELRVRTGRSTLGFPGLFAEPAIPLDSLKAQARWSIERAGSQPAVSVEIAELRFANADAAGLVSGSYRTGGKGPGIVDLLGWGAAQTGRLAAAAVVEMMTGKAD